MKKIYKRNYKFTIQTVTEACFAGLSNERWIFKKGDEYFFFTGIRIRGTQLKIDIKLITGETFKLHVPAHMPKTTNITNDVYYAVTEAG